MNRTDGLILILAIGLVAALAFWQWRPAGSASGVVVWHNGEPVHHLNLSRDTHVTVEGPLGATSIQVDAGRVRVSESPGSRQLCVRAGWMQFSGETAVCLPNRVVVEVTGNDPRFDAINQ